MIPYEDISNAFNVRRIQAPQNLAEQLLQKGWSPSGYPPILLQEPVPWLREQESERTWHAQIQGLELIDALLRAHSATQEYRYLEMPGKVIIDWLNAYKAEHFASISSYTWYGMAVGLRAYRLAYFLDAAEQNNLLGEDERSRLWEALLEHQRYLADDANIIFHNNHGYYQIAGQMAMGRRLKDRSEKMAEAYEQGQSRLKEILLRQFSEDGVHLEHSPDYHRMVYSALVAIVRSGLVTDSEVAAFTETIEEALSWFVLPNRHIANFGDSDYRRLSYNKEHATATWQTPAMLWLTTGGRIGTLPEETVKAFTSGGYFVVRKTETGGGATSYLAQQLGFHSRTHKQADDLTFIWHDRGTDILVDAGRYGYIGKAEQGSDLWKEGFWYTDPNRIYCESTRAHNCLEFDGRNYKRKGVKPYGSALRRWQEHPSGLVVVESECKQFQSIRQARILFFMPSQWLIVFDWFHDNAREEHDVRQWFHFASGLHLISLGESFMALAPGSKAPLRVASLFSSAQASPLQIGQDKGGPNMQGWWSPKERDVVPNYAVHYALSQVTHGAFATLFVFSDSLRPNTSWSKCNASGRDGQFQWDDDNGKHILTFSRQAKEALSIGYEAK